MCLYDNFRMTNGDRKGCKIQWREHSNDNKIEDVVARSAQIMILIVFEDAYTIKIKYPIMHHHIGVTCYQLLSYLG